MPNNTVPKPIQWDYSINGLLRLRVLDRTGTPGTGFIHKQLSSFLTEETGQQPDLIVSQEKNLSTCSQLGVSDNKYHVGEDQVCWSSSYKLGSWQVAIDGLESPPVRVTFSGNRFAPKYIFFHVVEPLINYLLALKGSILLHSSGVGDGYRGYVFASRSGAGKTSLALHLLNSGLPQFLGDEFLILTEKGCVASFPLSINLFRHNVLSNPFLHPLMPAAERRRIKFNWLLYRFSAGWAKPGRSVPIKNLFPDVDIPQMLPLGALAMLVSTDERDISVLQHDSPIALVDELLKMNKFEFRFLQGALDAYKTAHPQSEVCLHDDRCRRILAGIVEQVPCYQISVPRRFIFDGSSAHSELSKLLTLAQLTPATELPE